MNFIFGFYQESTGAKERNIVIKTAPQGCLIQVILFEAAYTQAKCMLIESRSILTHSLLKEGIIFFWKLTEIMISNFIAYGTLKANTLGYRYVPGGAATLGKAP